MRNHESAHSALYASYVHEYVPETPHYRYYYSIYSTADPDKEQNKYVAGFKPKQRSNSRWICRQFGFLILQKIKICCHKSSIWWFGFFLTTIRRCQNPNEKLFSKDFVPNIQFTAGQMNQDTHETPGNAENGCTLCTFSGD